MSGFDLSDVTCKQNHWSVLNTFLNGMKNGKIYGTRKWTFSTLGPAYNEFGCYEHLAIMRRFFSKRGRLLIDINV